MEINATSRLYHCFSCHAGGVAPVDWGPALSQLPNLSSRPAASPLATPQSALSVKMPPLALQEIARRRQEVAWIVHRYMVRWDGERLSWPAGKGFSRRSVIPWEKPKTLTVPPKGLIGEHLLIPGSRVVVVEGDWKAASIPLPWVGVGLMGTIMSEEQKWTLLTSNPQSITVLLDGGYTYAALKIQEQLLPYRAKVLDLPKDKGPDDIPRRDLVRLLMKGAG